MPNTLEDLLAESAIRDLHRRYCRGVDRLDWELVRDCFHPDADTYYGAHFDVPGFVEMAIKGLAIYTITTHFIGNQLVEVDGDSAWAEHYTIAYHRAPAAGSIPEHDYICNLRYLDRVEKRGGAWRIARRELLGDSERRVPLPDLGPTAALGRGSRDRADPSYARP